MENASIKLFFKEMERYFPGLLINNLLNKAEGGRVDDDDQYSQARSSFTALWKYLIIKGSAATDFF